MFDFFCCVELEPEKVFIYKSTCEMHNPLNVTYMSETYREFKLIDRKYCSYGVRMYYHAYTEIQPPPSFSPMYVCIVIMFFYIGDVQVLKYPIC